MDATINQIQYRGYTIQVDYRNPYSNTPEYMYYPTEQGVQHDGEYEDGWHYTGNCQWASDIDEAKDMIDQFIMESKPMHIVKTNFGMLEYTFNWLDEAIAFQKIWGGDLLPYGQPILNP